MKKLYFFLFLLSTIQGYAQNYSTITPSRPSFFATYASSFNYPFYYAPRSCDGMRLTLQSTNGNFTEYSNYRHEVADGFFSGCLNFRDTGWAGHRIVQDVTTGSTWYFNANDDSISFDATAGAGQQGFFYRYPNGNKIIGTVSAVSSMNFITLIDSVRTITLQAYDALGGNIANDFNGLQIEISKNYGIIKAYNWHNFPNDTAMYELAGMENAQVGAHIVTAVDIYNFAIGDRFDFRAVSNSWAQSNPNSSFYYSKVLTAKTISANGDTIRYTWVQDYAHLIGIFVASYAQAQTVMTTVVLSEKDSLLEFPLDHLEFAHGPDSAQGYYENKQPIFPFDPTIFNGRMMKGQITFMPFYYDQNAGCFMAANLSWGPCDGGYEIYADGLGLVTSRFGSATCFNNGDLLYYEKGAETWGTPIDWSVVLGIDQSVSPVSILRTWPNPATDKVCVETNDNSGAPVHYQILNSSGQLLGEGVSIATAGVLEVPVNELPGGFYFLRIQIDGSVRITKFIR
jgi:hypothetical protein